MMKTLTMNRSFALRKHTITHTYTVKIHTNQRKRTIKNKCKFSLHTPLAFCLTWHILPPHKAKEHEHNRKYKQPYKGNQGVWHTVRFIDPQKPVLGRNMPGCCPSYPPLSFSLFPHPSNIFWSSALKRTVTYRSGLCVTERQYEQVHACMCMRYFCLGFGMF